MGGRLGIPTSLEGRCRMQGKGLHPDKLQQHSQSLFRHREYEGSYVFTGRQRLGNREAHTRQVWIRVSAAGSRVFFRDRSLTLSGERDGASSVGDRGDLVHLEPHGAVSRERADVPVRRLGHVDVHDLQKT